MIFLLLGFKQPNLQVHIWIFGGLKDVFSGFVFFYFVTRYEPKTLVCIPIQSNEQMKKMYQFEENCINIEDVRVSHSKA